MLLSARRLVIAASLLSIAGSTAPAIAQSAALSQKATKSADIVTSAQSRGHARVIVTFAPSPVADQLRPGNEAIVNDMKQHVARTQDAIIASVFGSASDPAPGQGFGRALQRFDVTPGFAVNVTLGELEALARDPRVVAISPDRIDKPLLNQSLPLIGMTEAYAAGANGSGYAVAVLDTGSQANHKFLSANIVGQVCYSGGGGLGATLCPNGESAQIGAGASEATTPACIGNGTNICTHGSHVAGIAAGSNTHAVAGEPVSGVARSAKILDMQVFSRFSDPADCGGNAPCVLTVTSDQIRALDYVLQNTVVGGAKIAAVNMSLGGGDFASACDEDPRKTAIDRLRAIGILTVVAAGNDGYKNSVGAPACISTALTVGSTTKSDQVSVFSNIGETVDVLAPGGAGAGACANGGDNPNIHSALAGLSANDNAGFVCYAGTSMAAPHVAGAVAAIRTVCPSASADAIETALRTTGLAVTDQRPTGSFVRPRIRVDQAIASLNCARPTTVISSILPSSRSVQVGSPATAFATIINTGANAGGGCVLSLGAAVSGEFIYQTTNAATNALTGTPNTAVTLSPGASQSFVFAIYPSAAVTEANVPIVASCANSAPAQSVVGLNTLLFSASTTAVPDVLALGLTGSNDGILTIPGPAGASAFAVATANTGAGAAVVGSAVTGSAALPLTLTICQTNPATGACISPIGPTVSVTIGANETPTFAVFAQATGPIPFDPANNRIFVRFREQSGATRGSTSVAVRTR